MNDRLGHQTGDGVLQTFARLLARLHEGQAQPHDLVARLGGEEFVWLLDAPDRSALLGRVEALRQQVEGMPDMQG